MSSLANPAGAPDALAADIVAARVAHRDAQEVATKCARTFRRAIVAALDAGMRQQDVAELAQVSRGRLHAIIVAEYSRP